MIFRKQLNGGPCLAAWLFLWLILLPFYGQSADDPPKETVPRIEWHSSSPVLIQSNGYYGRIIRLRNNELLCGFDFHGQIWVRHSRDQGKTWEKPVHVAQSAFAALTNTELLQLKNGSLLCLYNERPNQNSAKAAPEGRPYAICLARSEDNGKSWQEPETLYRAGTEFTNGCWEPAAIELASGEVQLFFSNEGPYRNSNEQEITLLRSADGARTWSSPERVSFRPGGRDGMPVPLVLKNNRGIAFSIEDIGLSGNFKPVVVVTSLEDNWRSGVRGPENTNRWSALNALPLPHVAASAPYLRQMPSGETVLSFQRSDTGEMRDAYMVVCIGDEAARNFDAPSRPFPATPGKPQLWNSLFVKDDQTVVAISEATLNGVQGVWSVEGRFVRRK